MPRDPKLILIDFLRDAHVIEEQALLQLEAVHDLAGEARLTKVLREHLTETLLHEATVKRLLDERGAASREAPDDQVIAGGGLIFAFFARARRDAPGRLATHMYAYEALEAAGYTLLARFARHVGDVEVEEAALEIRADEVRTMERIADLFDVTVTASLRKGDGRLLERMRAHLVEAHALEVRSIELLQAGVVMVDHPTWHELFEDHLHQTRRQKRLLEQRLDALGADDARLEGPLAQSVGSGWSAFLRAQSSWAPKFAAFMFAFEHLEAAGYAQLHRVAELAGDLGTQVAVDQIMLEEKQTATRFSDAFEEVVDLAALE